MSTEENLKRAKELFEKISSEAYANEQDEEKYSLYLGLYCLADALQQMLKDIETIRDDVQEIKHKG